MPVDDDDVEDDLVEEQDDDEDAVDEDGEEFIVEAIKDHKFEGKVRRDCRGGRILVWLILRYLC